MVILFDTSPTPNPRAMSKRVPHPCRVFGDRACPEIVEGVGNLTLDARPAFYLYLHANFAYNAPQLPRGPVNLNQIQRRRSPCPQLQCARCNPRSKSELRPAVVLTTSFFLPWRC